MSLQNNSLNHDSNHNKGTPEPPMLDERSESHLSDEEKTGYSEPVNPQPQAWASFPDGGARAWAVAGGCSAVLFATFGMANAFG